MFEALYYTYKFTYAESYAWNFFRDYLETAFYAFSVSYLIYVVGLHFRNRTFSKSNPKAEEKSITEGIDFDSSFADIKSYFQQELGKEKELRYRIYQLFYWASSFVSWYGWFYFSISPSALSSLHVITLELGIVMTLVIAMLKWTEFVILNYPDYIREVKGNQTNSYLNQVVRHFKRGSITTRLYKERFIVFALFAIIYSFCIPLATSNICLNVNNEGYGFNFHGFGASTRLTRYLELEKPCPEGKVCHIYATLPEDGSTTAFINVQTGVDVKSITLGYDTLENYQTSSKLLNTITATGFEAGLEDLGNRYIHTAYLRNLVPNTTYYFEIYYDDKKQGSGTYLTFPSKEMERNILMISGGDVGTSHIAKEMTATVAKYTPDVILVGGDVAYDNGITACYYSYDLFLKMFEEVNEKSGRLVLLFFNIGNHDLGFNAFQDSVVDITKNPFFMYFPQNSRTDSEGNLLPEVPNFAERLPYNYHTMGNTLQVTLDSGYLTKYNGVQLDFLKNVSEKYDDLVKLANYHVPSYPLSYLRSHNDYRTIEHAQLYWHPLFQEHKYASVFENHGHLYKKTHPILDGLPNPGGDGVIYFGDGNWGVPYPDPIVPTIFPGVFEKSGITNHVWIVNITNEDITYYAIDKSGQVIDEAFKLPVSNYIKS